VSEALQLSSGELAETWNVMVKHPADFQESLIKLGAVLPTHLHYAGIEAACRCADMHPETLYQLITSGRALPESFCEALLGPDWKRYLTGRM